MPFHDDFLGACAANINALAAQGLFKREMLIDGRWRHNSWLHARVLGVMARSVPAPDCPMMEVIWQQGFKPDLCVVEPNEETLAVVEYESTNSSDERLILKDLAHFESCIRWYAGGTTERLPSWWILISTLPDEPVHHWPWWGYNDDVTAPPAVKDAALRNANPLAYYRPGMEASFASAWGRILATFRTPPATNLVWANLAPDGIQVLHLNGVAMQQPFFPLQLP